RAVASGVPVYGTFLDGADIYQSALTPGGVIVMGNEGNGISDAVARLCTHRLRIPSFPPERTTVESLNVGTAAAVTVSQFRQRQQN
ncbi:MAG: RNA methyltransferase, partial [Muribaculaceae bacterium]|nr:RNA methyltransferase [Muribaculaceae bacterium]